MIKSASIYKFNTGKIILHPKNRVKDSASYASGPYIIEQDLTYKEIAEKLLATLEHSIDDAPQPLDWKAIQKNHLTSMGVKTMKVLHDNSLYVSVFTKDGNYNIQPYINKGSKQGFHGTKDKIIIPTNSSIEELATALEDSFNKCS
ncbi:MAG: CdiI family contact-dependent growth inhibition immunity protein [Flavobacteriales bacterium]|nr:CdiI family contact-dependent growth inhibition immunity protein [Flavobacteriales bacterium]